MPRARRILRLSVVTLSVLLMCLGLVFAALQTGWGKNQLASVASRLASSEGLTVEIEEIGGFVPSSMTVGKITASDAAGEFAAISGFHLSWNPLALLFGEVSVSSVGAESISVLRSPDLPASEDRSGSSLALPRIVIGDLSIPLVALGEGVLGAEAELAVSGAAALREPERGLSADIQIRRLDAEGTIGARLSYTPASDLLDVDLSAREGEGGLIARALQIADLPPVEARIAGKGPLGAFLAKIDLAAGDRGSVSGTITTAKDGDAHRVVGDLQAQLAGLLPAQFAALVDGVSELHADLRIAPDYVTDIRTLTLRSAAAGVSLVGSVSPPEDRVGLTGKIVAAEPHVFASLLPDAHWSALTADLRIEGSVSRPSVTADIAAEDLAAAGRDLGRLELEAAAALGEEGALSVSLKGQGRHQGKDVVALKGSVAREADGGIVVRDLALSAFGAAAHVNGRLDPDRADLVATLRSDLAEIDGRLEGRAEGEARFSGSLEKLNLVANLGIAEGKAMGEAIQNLSLEITAQDLTGLVSAQAKASGFVGGRMVEGDVVLTSPEEMTRRLDRLVLNVGSARIEGQASVPQGAPVTGEFRVNAPDLAELSAFALKTLGGRMDANLVLSADAGAQAVEVTADAADVAADDVRINTARAALRLVDPAKLASISGSVEISGVRAGANTVDKARLTANPAGAATDIVLAAKAQGADIAASALLRSEGEARHVTLKDLTIARQGNRIALLEPSEIRIDDNGASIERLRLSAGGGQVDVRGHAGQSLDLAADIKALPLSLASLASPGLAISGTLSGQAEIRGNPDAPEGAYRLQVSRLSMPELARSGAGPLDIRAEGSLSGGRASVDLGVSGPSLSGVSLTGTVPVAGGPLDLAAKGVIGLGLANPMLATSGARLAGSASVDARIGGTASDPQVAGTIRVSEGRFEDTVNGIALERVTALVTGDGQKARLSSLTAQTRDGGSLNAEGEVAIEPARGFPGRIAINFSKATLVQSEIMRFVSDGAFTLEGELATSPRITGRLDVRALDFIIPERVPGGADSLDVRHVNAPGRRDGSGKRDAQKPKAGTSVFSADLDLVVSAPNNVFVRGMGMETELGGELKISGTSANPTPFGAFEMRRGRFDVMGKRLDFSRGKVDFAGTLDPGLDFVAQTTASDITAQVLVGGTASAPEISFASTPSLPQDEVIARLMFGRSSAQLTAGQALQVAQTIMQFSGGGPGVMDGIRQSLGVDSLDIGTGEGGKGGQVGIGKRLNDRIYFGVKQGTEAGSTKATIDIDITRNIRVQGATNPQGGSEVGLGAQWDY